MKQLLTNASLFFVTTAMLVCFIVPTAFGQEQAPARAESFPADSVFAKVDKIFAQWDKPDSPGCALGVIKDGRLIYTRGYGMANLDYDIPISASSVFDIASITKQFTAMSILLLSKQGKLSLDDEIQEYLPEIPRYESPVTIRHLIHHTSGLRSGFVLAQLLGMDSEKVYLTGDDVLRLLALQEGPSNKAGEEGGYLNTGYLLLGFIVKRVSGTSLREYAEENIFKPLGMRNTHFHDDQTMVIKNRVTGYFTEDDGRYSVMIDEGFAVALGPSGLFTTIEDLFLWDQNFNDNKLGGGPDLIKDFLSGSVLNNGEIVTYAFGIGVGEHKGLKRIGHGGDNGGVQLEMQRYPEQNFSVYCLCNLDTINPRRLANQVADIFLADQFEQDVGSVAETARSWGIALLAAPVVSRSVEQLRRFEGVWYSAETNEIRRTRMNGETLTYVPPGSGTGLALVPLGGNRFRVGEGPPRELAFETDGTGRPQRVRNSNGFITTISEAVDTQQQLTTAQLAEFAGKYRSDELPGATYSLSIKDEKLRLLVRNAMTVLSRERGLTFFWTRPDKSEAANGNLLTPVSADFFVFVVSDKSGTLTFTRNRQNAVSGFVLSVGSVGNLRFNKL